MSCRRCINTLQKPDHHLGQHTLHQAIRIERARGAFLRHDFEQIIYFFIVRKNTNSFLIGNNANALAIRILDFFDEKEMSGKPVQEEELLRFKDNCSALAGRFFDVISVDFAFIKKLNEKYDKEINRELKKVARDFKKDKILD